MLLLQYNIYLFKESKETVDYYNQNKQDQDGGQTETESTTNSYEQITPSELSAGEHQYEIPPAGKFSTYSFSSGSR